MAKTDQSNLDSNLDTTLDSNTDSNKALSLVIHKKHMQVIHRLAKLIASNQVSAEQIADAFSDGQVLSKIWLVDECLNLNLDLKTIFLCGGWYATLFLDPRLKYDKARSFDIDPKCERIANEILHDLVMQDWKFKATTCDIHEIKYDHYQYKVRRSNGSYCDLSDTADTVINTSCEHIENFNLWFSQIPKGKLVILQSNDGFHIPDHINCSKSLEDFARITPLSQVLYSESKAMPQFNRFMRIGYK